MTRLSRCTSALAVPLTVAALAAAYPYPVLAQPAKAPVGTSAGTRVAGKAGLERYTVIDGEKAPVPVIAMGDPATIARIIDEGKNHNKVMDHLTYLSTRIGARLTGSASVEAANRWEMEQLKSWGLKSELWQWGEIPVRFDRGPSTGKVGTVREGDDGNPEFQSQRDLEFTSLAWGAGTDGPVRGKVVRMPSSEEELEAAKDDIKGAWVLIKATAPGGRRGVINSMSGRQRAFAEIRKKWAGDEGTPAPEKGDAAKPAAEYPKDGVSGLWEGNATGAFGYPGYQTGPLKGGRFDPETHRLTFTWEGPGGDRKYTFTFDGKSLTGAAPTRDGKEMKYTGAPASSKPAAPAPAGLEEKVLALGPAGFISSSGDERVRTSSIRGWRELTMDTLPQDVEVQVRRSDYDYINSRLADGNEVYAEFDLKNQFTPGPIPCYDTIAEIKGTTWPDEVVIVSAHTDSWNGPGSMGTTDNGTGTSVTLEAARILAAAKVKPKRTIRFILWTGEEQGLLGSAAYVKMLKEKGELDKISACFVDDGGTNYEGGLKCFTEQAPFLEAATAPVNGVFYSETDGKWLDVNIQPSANVTGRPPGGGGSDHQSFFNAGVPGFFWDEVGRADYGYGWHTQNDKLDLAIPEYLVQSSTCAAVTAYNLACAPGLLPRPAKVERKDEAKPAQRAAEKPADTQPERAKADAGARPAGSPSTPSR
jgi:hypothetical protein